MRPLYLAYRLYSLYLRLVHPVTLGVRILLLADDTVVLVQHTYQDAWHFPGGALKKGETPPQRATREAHEETGAELLAAPALLGLHTNFHEGRSDHIVTFLCRNFRMGEARRSLGDSPLRAVCIGRAAAGAVAGRRPAH